jgi:hypothetical protein
MKHKYIVLIIFVIVVVVILYLYKRCQSPDRPVSFMDELEAKQKKLDLVFAQLSAATIKKACLDRVATWKTSLITCILLLLCMGTSLIFDLYKPDNFSGLYITAAWYLLTLIGTLGYHKILSWSAIMEIIASRIRTQEYQNHNFDPDSIPLLTIKVVVLKEEIGELKERQAAISSQNACGYR